MEPMIAYAPPPVGRDEARELARRELSREIYHRDEPSFVERVMRKIGDWLDSLLDHVPGNHPGGGGGWVAVLVIVAILLLIAAAIWWRTGSLRRNAGGRGSPRDETHSPAEDHRAAAGRHAAAGEWPQAIRERLRAIARDLEERVIVEPRAGRTADELAAEAGAALPGHADALLAGVRVFDDVWYGGRDGDAAGYEQLTDLDRRLRTARPTPLAAGGTP